MSVKQWRGMLFCLQARPQQLLSKSVSMDDLQNHNKWPMCCIGVYSQFNCWSKGITVMLRWVGYVTGFCSGDASVHHNILCMMDTLLFLLPSQAGFRSNSFIYVAKLLALLAA